MFEQFRAAVLAPIALTLGGCGPGEKANPAQSGSTVAIAQGLTPANGKLHEFPNIDKAVADVRKTEVAGATKLIIAVYHIHGGDGEGKLLSKDGLAAATASRSQAHEALTTIVKHYSLKEIFADGFSSEAVKNLQSRLNLLHSVDQDSTGIYKYPSATHLLNALKSKANSSSDPSERLRIGKQVSSVNSNFAKFDGLLKQNAEIRELVRGDVVLSVAYEQGLRLRVTESAALMEKTIQVFAAPTTDEKKLFETFDRRENFFLQNLPKEGDVHLVVWGGGHRMDNNISAYNQTATGQERFSLVEANMAILPWDTKKLLDLMELKE